MLVAGAGAAAGSSGLTKEGFLTRWRVITLEDPRTAFEQVGTSFLAGLGLVVL